MRDDYLRALHEHNCLVVSECTLRPQDLLPTFLDALRVIHPEAYDQVMMPGCGFSAFPCYAQEDETAKWWDDDAPWLLESIANALCEAAPDGFYFGAHPDDGACFGFWRED